jgi:hypothetical protein
MDLPGPIAERIRAWVTDTPKASFHVDQQSARYGGISLMGTIGSIWLLRPDGTLWEVDDDSGKPLRPLAEQFQTTALVAGPERHSWLAELLPRRPSAAIDCSQCMGTGKLRVGEDPEQFVYCPTCHALGWTSS